jgi:hypothetical protein
MIILQERDRKILKLCYEQQFLMTDHVEKYFSNASYRACRMRVQELVEGSFLREELTSTLGRKPIYRTTKTGTIIALENGATPHTPIKNLQLATLVHDAIVTSVRQRLEDYWDAQFICERAIKGNEYKQIPDGIFFFKSGKGIAIEVENSDKGRSRFIRLLSRWKEVPGILFVLYVATNDFLFESIKKHLKQAPTEQPMGVVHWNQLKQSTPAVWTQRGEVRLFDKRDYL